MAISYCSPREPTQRSIYPLKIVTKAVFKLPKPMDTFPPLSSVTFLQHLTRLLLPSPHCSSFLSYFFFLVLKTLNTSCSSLTTTSWIPSYNLSTDCWYCCCSEFSSTLYSVWAISSATPTSVVTKYTKLQSPQSLSQSSNMLST